MLLGHALDGRVWLPVVATPARPVPTFCRDRSRGQHPNMGNSFLSVIVLLLTTATAFGQQPLSIDQAISLGLANNYQVQVSRAAMAVAENNDSWALTGKYPTVELSLSSSNAYSGSDNPASVVVESDIITNGVAPGITANWVLYNGMRVENTKVQLSRQRTLTNEQLRIQMQNTVQNILQAYYGALVQREQLDVLAEVLTLSRDRIRYQETRREFGQAGTFDLLQAQDAYLTDSTTYLIQLNAYDNALRNLQLAMGMNASGQSYSLSDSLEAVTTRYTLAELEQKLRQNNPDLQASAVNIQLAEINTQLLDANRLPVVSMSLGGNYNINVSTGSQTFNFGGNRNVQDLPGVAASTLRGFVNLNATYNLWDGGLQKTRVQSARLQELQSQMQYNSLEETLRTQLANALATYENQQRLMDITSQRVENAAENMTIAEERLRGGLINSFDYRSIQLAYVNATQARLNAMLNLKNTQTELMRLTGELMR